MAFFWVNFWLQKLPKLGKFENSGAYQPKWGGGGLSS